MSFNNELHLSLSVHVKCYQDHGAGMTVRSSHVTLDVRYVGHKKIRFVDPCFVVLQQVYIVRIIWASSLFAIVSIVYHMELVLFPYFIC